MGTSMCVHACMHMRVCDGGRKLSRLRNREESAQAKDPSASACGEGRAYRNERAMTAATGGTWIDI